MRTEEVTKIGVIGAGNLGSALIAGWLQPSAELVVDPGPTILVADKDAGRIAALGARFGDRVCVAASIEEVAAAAHVVIVAVKPQEIDDVIGHVGRTAGPGQAVVSTAAGAGLNRLRASLGPGPDLYRIMPNLAVAVGEGVVALAPEPGTLPEDLATVKDLFLCMGIVEVLPESVFDAVTAVTASGPGFMAVLLEGLEDGAVSAGLPRLVARRFVRQMARGTTGLMLGDEGSAADLKDHVSSPAGTTIAGLAVLEDRGVRGALVRAVEAATERSHSLGVRALQ